MKPDTLVLKNGLRVILVPSHASEVVAFQMWVGVGSADERSGEEGLAHVFEHMLFKGTKKRAVGEITRDVERVGGQINAWTSPDETVFYITLASRFWADGLSILADAIANPALDADELASELSVIREEIRMGEDSPDRVVIRSLFRSVFKKHPYGRPVIGYDRTVKGFTRKDVLAFYRRWYVPENMVLSIAGDFDRIAMKRKIRALFNPLGGGQKCPKRSTRITEPTQIKPRFGSAARPISEVHLAIGYPAPGLTHEDIPALDMLAAILGQGASSRLEMGIRREQALVNGIRAMSYTPVDAGIFGVFATLPQANLQRASAAILEELERLRSNPVSESELEKARTLLESDKVYSEETVDGIARKLGFYWMHAGDIEFEDKYLLQLMGLGPDDLQAIANRYLLPGAVNIAAVLPDPNVRPEPAKFPWVKGRANQRRIDSNKLHATFQKTVDSTHKKRLSGTARIGPRDGVVVHKLSTGDTLLVRRSDTSNLVAVRAAFWGGSRLEKNAQAGISALLANSLTKGAAGMSASEIATQLDAMACSIEGFSGRNTVGISGEFLKRNFEKGFALMASCLRNPSFGEEDVALEKSLLKEDIRAANLNPGYVVFSAFSNALFGTHPYGRPTWGTEESIDSFKPAMLKKHLKKFTAPGTMVMAVEGGVNADAAVELVEKHFVIQGKAAPTNRNVRISKAPDAVMQVLRTMQKEQSHVVIGFKGTQITDPNRFAVEVMTEILGGHGGRLFETVREKKGLAYAVTATALSGIEPGYIALYAATSPGNEVAVSSAMLEEIHRISDAPVPVRELHRVKQHLIGARAIARQRAASRAASTALDYLYGNGPNESDHYAARIDAVSKDDIRHIAGALLDPSRRIAVCVGPKTEGLSLV